MGIFCGKSCQAKAELYLSQADALNAQTSDLNKPDKGNGLKTILIVGTLFIVVILAIIFFIKRRKS